MVLSDTANSAVYQFSPHRSHDSVTFSPKDMMPHHASRPTKVVEPGALPELNTIILPLAKKRVVFIGETHTRLADHENQLAIIRGLFDQGKKLAIGIEFFQQPFQPHLDDFIAGSIDDADLLARTEYYARWQYDYRLYQPILDFARKQGIPLVALNVSSEIVKRVSKEGWDALAKDNTLTREELAQIPEVIDQSNKDYEERLREIFRQHDMAVDTLKTTWRWRFPDAGGMKKSQPRKGVTNFQRFMEVQLLWDEGMAERAAKYVIDHPTRTLIVLAGSGHLSYGDGIPNRLKRRVPVDIAIVLPADGVDPDPDVADFLLISEEKYLPPQGTLGILLDTDAEGVRVASFPEESAAKAAGIEIQDRIRFIGERPIKAVVDMKLALRNKRPGDRISVGIHRTGWFANWLTDGKDLRFEVELK